MSQEMTTYLKSKMTFYIIVCQAKQTMHMECQDLSFLKKKKKINMPSAAVVIAASWV